MTLSEALVTDARLSGLQTASICSTHRSASNLLQIIEPQLVWSTQYAFSQRQNEQP